MADLIEISKCQEGSYGKHPEARTIAELLESGIIILDKPPGPTSRDVTEHVKSLLGTSKAGHEGTLDPPATGVLPITLGNATKTTPLLQGLDKTYVAVIHIHRDFTKDELGQAIRKFTGIIKQKPPVRSAVSRKTRKRKVYSIKILDIEGRNACIEVSCEAGTYIRKLASDIGAAMGTGCHLRELRRTAAGNFSESESHTLQELEEAWKMFEGSGDEKPLRRMILPIETALNHVKSVTVKDSAIPRILDGSPIFTAGICKVSKDIRKDENTAIFSLKGELIALGIAKLRVEEIAKKQALAFKVDRIIKGKK